MDQHIDVAINKRATQSSVSNWSQGRSAEEDASRAISDTLHEDYAFHTLTEVDPWWQVDLGEEFNVREVRILNRKTSADRLRHFTVLLSLDASIWKVACERDDDALGDQDSDIPLVIDVKPNGSIARFVRIQLKGKKPLHFRQCQVFGEQLGQSHSGEADTQTGGATTSASPPSFPAFDPAFRPQLKPAAPDGIETDPSRTASQRGEPAAYKSTFDALFGWLRGRT